MKKEFMVCSDSCIVRYRHHIKEYEKKTGGLTSKNFIRKRTKATVSLPSQVRATPPYNLEGDWQQDRKLVISKWPASINHWIKTAIGLDVPTAKAMLKADPYYRADIWGEIRFTPFYVAAGESVGGLAYK